jgi:DNA modification methylase
MTNWQIIEGDCRDVLAMLPERSVHTCVTSPPYFGLRDYGHDGQIGLEPTPDEFVAALVAVFREVRRVLRDDGTVWLNLGDSYAGSWGAQSRGGPPSESSTLQGNGHRGGGPKISDLSRVQIAAHPKSTRTGSIPPGAEYKPKDLIGIPWAVAFALRADGWYLRSDIVWSKPNPMPESVTDRPTKAHEYLFLLSKGPRYYYDGDAIREPHLTADDARNREDFDPSRGSFVGGGINDGRTRTSGASTWPDAGRNKRSVWTVATQPYAGAHFATFPPKLIEPCILAGAPERACGECRAPWVRVVERIDTGRRQKMADGWDVDEGGHGSFHRNGRAKGETGVPVMENRTVGFEPPCTHGDDTARGVVLDPFAGAGTTGVVALRHGRNFIGIELNPEYADLARPRLERYWRDTPRPAAEPQIGTLF